MLITHRYNPQTKTLLVRKVNATIAVLEQVHELSEYPREVGPVHFVQDQYERTRIVSQLFCDFQDYTGYDTERDGTVGCYGL